MSGIGVQPTQTKATITSQTMIDTQVVVMNYFFRFGIFGAPHWVPSVGGSLT